MSNWWNGLHKGLKILPSYEVMGSNPIFDNIILDKK